MLHEVINGWVWLGFCVFVILALGFDTYALNKGMRKSRTHLQVALFWTAAWICLALTFNILLWCYAYYYFDLPTANEIGLSFFAGYLIEKSLSIDNMFAFYLVFHQLRIPIIYQQRIFTYGIWGAIIMRLLLILLGAWLVTQFHWLIYVMGAFLAFTGVKMFFSKDEAADINQSKLYGWLQKHLRLTHHMDEGKFFIKQNRYYYATPLFIALIFIELVDLIFAFDSIPAIFAITTDPFIVWTSNIFAILGLRALYFVLADMVNRFSLLKYGIALILAFVGVKMMIEPWINIPILVSLLMIAMIFAIFIAWSLARHPKGDK